VDPADLNALVKEALDQHVVPADDSYVVADVSGNTVMLIGHVRTEAQRDAVVRAAWRGHAVMAVVDQIEITG
jgi:osmotically-inducible protein OsmY